MHTSAASAASRLGSVPALPPSLRGGPVTLADGGGLEVLFCGGAEDRVRPGWEKGSGLDSEPQRLPIVSFVGVWDVGGV